MTFRFSLRDAPEVLPVFPLPGAILLPRARLPLNVFEPRYLAMFDDVLRSPHRMIGMIQPKENADSEDRIPDLYEVGCAGRLTQFNELPDGRYVVALTGISRFRALREETSFTPYRRLRVVWDEFRPDSQPTPPSTENDQDRRELLKLVRSYFDARGLEGDWDVFEAADEETLVTALCMLCPFEPSEKQALLEAANGLQRRKALAALLEMGAAGDPAGGGEAGGRLQ
ncbi:LON peptidase substrate-binding domain-containing protein [Neomegalonema sp.]|uniref:LON peptidase substrate-binding domain-containing protein n=1 Tax=Neomegalonema sp. TaxID=2039713 RepID=UPI0026282160|nr:LON peptidase substrate-binding domain-containing protein [Neomegalonema sp.]MDD2867975.1 LON peptidase substrate-binding domain-containing protein [Neomegalonema sp.]